MHVSARTSPFQCKISAEKKVGGSHLPASNINGPHEKGGGEGISVFVTLSIISHCVSFSCLFLPAVMSEKALARRSEIVGKIRKIISKRIVPIYLLGVNCSYLLIECLSWLILRELEVEKDDWDMAIT